LVFTIGLGRLIDARNLIRHYSDALKRAGVPYRNFHALRHTAASLLLAHSGDLFRVQQALGHLLIALTADLYGHTIPALLADVAERIGHKDVEERRFQPPLFSVLGTFSW
jgi:integrase